MFVLAGIIYKRVAVAISFIPIYIPSVMNPTIKRVIWAVNTVGFVVYLVWLMQFSTGETMRSQDGILYYVPCLPFLFVYMLLANPRKPKSDADQAGDPSESFREDVMGEQEE